MPTRSDRLGREARQKQKAIDAFHARMDLLLQEGIELEDEAMARRLRNVNLALSARERKLKLAGLERDVKDADEADVGGRTDALEDGIGSDEARRAQLLARLSALAAALEQKGADRCPACGRSPALQSERDALWARLSAAEFLTVGERRRMAGLGELEAGE